MSTLAEGIERSAPRGLLVEPSDDTGSSLFTRIDNKRDRAGDEQTRTKANLSGAVGND